MDWESRVVKAIRQIPQGKVSTYGAIARAAGTPGLSRQVARIMSNSYGLPWHRVVGAGGQIKTPGEWAAEQRLRLEFEGVRFRGRRIDMTTHEHHFRLARRRKSHGKEKKSGKPSAQ